MRSLPLLAAALSIMAVLSGCFGNSTTSTTGTMTKSATAAANVLPPPVPYYANPDGPVPASAFPGQLPVFQERYILQRGGGEPTVGINKNGDIIFPTIAFDINAAGQSFPSTRVMISHNEGLNWTDSSPVLAGGQGGRVPVVRANPASLDPYVYADPVTGRLFNIDLNLAVGGFLSYTDDGGKTWTSQPGCCGIPVDDHQSLFSGPATTLVPVSPLYQRILYFCINQIGATTCTHSLDGGLSWSAGVPAYPGVEPPGGDNQGGGVCGGLSGHGHASEKTGTVFVPKGQCGKAEVARSTDNGLSFTDIVVDQSVGMPDHEAIVSTDKAGNVYYFFLDKDTLPRVSVSRDDGLTWSPPLNVTVPGVTAAKFPSIVAGDTGKIAFLYLGTTTPHGHHVADTYQGNGTLKYPDELQNATWAAYVGVSLNALDEHPVFATVTAHDPVDPLDRGACSGRCFGTVNGGMYDFLDIDIKPDTGQVYVALIDNCNNDQPYNAPACNGPGGNAQSYQRSRAAVGVQVGGTLLGSALP